MDYRVNPLTLLKERSGPVGGYDVTLLLLLVLVLFGGKSCYARRADRTHSLNECIYIYIYNYIYIYIYIYIYAFVYIFTCVHTFISKNFLIYSVPFFRR